MAEFPAPRDQGAVRNTSQAQIGEISQRFYRVFFVLMCVASGIGLLTLIYFNFWFNRLAAVTFLVDFSTFLLVGFLLLLIVRYTLLIVFAFLQHLERSHEPWHRQGGAPQDSTSIQETATIHDVPRVSG
jgi:hypothetical protein